MHAITQTHINIQFQDLVITTAAVHCHDAWHVTITDIRLDMDSSTPQCSCVQRSAQFHFRSFKLLSCFDVGAPWLGSAKSGGSSPYVVSRFKHIPPGSYRASSDFACLAVPGRNKQCAPSKIAWPPLSWPNSAKLEWCENGRNKVMETLRHVCKASSDCGTS